MVVSREIVVCVMRICGCVFRRAHCVHERVHYVFRCENVAAARLPDIDLTARSWRGPKKIFGKKAKSPDPKPKDVKQIPGLESGFLVMVSHYKGRDWY